MPVAEQENLQAAEYVFAERIQAIDALFTFTTSSTEEECQRRAAAITALIVLCMKQESQGFRRRKADIQFKEEQTSPSVSSSPNLSKTLPVECKATQCIFCLGNEELSAPDRLKTFASRGDLKKHFHRKHLRHHPDYQPIACPHPSCDVTLNGTMHLQNHAALVHKHLLNRHRPWCTARLSATVSKAISFKCFGWVLSLVDSNVHHAL